MNWSDLYVCILQHLVYFCDNSALTGMTFNAFGGVATAKVSSCLKRILQHERIVVGWNAAALAAKPDGPVQALDASSSAFIKQLFTSY